MFKAKFIIAVIIILCSYLYFTNPDSITREGKVEGLCNIGRSILQGDRFWKLQLKGAKEKYNKSLSPGESMSSRMQDIDQIMSEVHKDTDDNSNGTYTPEKVMATSLRRKADSIEKVVNYREIDEWTEKVRLKTIKDWEMKITIIEAKLINAKTSYTPFFLLFCILVFALLVAISKHQKILSRKNRNYYNSEFEERNLSEWLEDKLPIAIFMAIGWFFIFLIVFLVEASFYSNGVKIFEDTTLLSILSGTIVYFFLVDQADKSGKN